MSQNSAFSPSKGHMTEYEELEKLFANFSEQSNHHEKSKILCSLVEEYTQHFKCKMDSNVKSAEFFQLLSQIPILCEKFLRIPNSGCINETVDKNQNLESASLCFQALLLCLDASYITEYGIMIKISLNILSQGYTHCKESEIIYGDLLEQFADQLGAFYKKIESLQVVVLQQLDNINVEKCAEDDLQISSIIEELGKLCQIIFDLDANAAFELWPKYLRIIAEHKSLKNVCNINDIFICLTAKNIEVLHAIKYSLDRNSEEDEELAAKFLFYLDALSNLMNLAPDSFKNNLLLYISFIRNLLDCVILFYSPFIIEKNSTNIIKNCLEKNVFALLSYLYVQEESLESILLTPSDKTLHRLSVFLLKLCSLQFLEKTHVQLKERFLREIFSELSSNSTEDDMKLLHISIPQCCTTKIQSDDLITLYQLTYKIVTEFLKSMPDTLIEKLENTIFNSLLTSSDVIYLLISDIWIYRLRCSTINFLKERCYAVLQNLHKENINNDKIENLAKRMLRFLPASYKDTLLEAFSSLKFIQDSKNIQHRFGIPDQTSIETEINSTTEDQINIMMRQLNENSSNDILTLVKKACICLELCISFVNVAGCSEIYQFLELASELFKTNIYEVQIATLSFLKSLSRKTMPENNQEFKKIVTILAQLFSETMQSQNYIVKYEARNIFHYFAKCTPHLQIVQDTVKKDPTLKQILKSHMNTIPENNFLSDKEKAEYLNKQMLISRNIKCDIPPKSIDSLLQIFSRIDFRFLI